MKPLNLLILMAEVFFSAFSVFLDAVSRAGAQAAGQTLRRSILPLYLCGTSTTEVETPPPPPMLLKALCLRELISVPPLLISTRAEPLPSLDARGGGGGGRLNFTFR